jgi:MoaA/NifB/PqqE/SkfB family radical SAM enzyme
MDFPSFCSFSITNRCNLACRMCGQWSPEGYMRSRGDLLDSEMVLSDWKRLADEAAENRTAAILLRGGEPFLFPGIIDLIGHIIGRGIPLSIDTNGTMLKQFAADLVRLEKLHLTISVDGPEKIHDEVRGRPGCFRSIKEGLEELDRQEKLAGKKISRSANFTISPWSLPGLGDLPDAVRELGLGTVTIVPYYYFPTATGEAYAKELRSLGAEGYSWKGFHQETSGIDPARFIEELRKFKAGLQDLYEYPYLPLSEQEYLAWFADAGSPVGPSHCRNIERLIDIQPSGDANLCVDFVDFAIGNVRSSSIRGLWKSERAERFRAFRREHPLSLCHRCGAKFMSCTYADYSK